MEFLMHKKDFRIMGVNPEGLKNEDYVIVTQEEANEVIKNKKYGLFIIADRNKKQQDAEYAELKAQFAGMGLGIENDLPASVVTNVKGADIPAEMPSLKKEEEIDPTEEFFSKSQETENSNFVDFSAMGIRELRKHAEARNIADFATKSKTELLEELTR